ncbi:MAG: hypothetical protein NTV57_05525 [Cyanobacteria bacterium]|nr:hypothetical protein [Cyanobacteriota bacterium]
MQGLWLLVLVGLVLQAWRQSSLVGSYDSDLDQLLYAGQRRLVGALTYRDFINGTPVVAQYFYAPSAWLESWWGPWLGPLRPHRLLLLALSLLGGGLLWSSLRQLGALGLLALRRQSLVPPFAALLYVVFVQLFPLGSSGLLPSIVDTLLVLVLFLGIRAGSLRVGSLRAVWIRPVGMRSVWMRGAVRPAGSIVSGRLAPGSAAAANVCLALAGAVLLLIVNALPLLLPPLLLTAVLLALLLELRRPCSWLWSILGGGSAALLLLLLPYLSQPGGLVQVWAGAVQLPLELARRGDPPGVPLLQRLAELLSLRVAGLPLWLFGLVPLLALLRQLPSRTRRSLGGRVRLLPALAVIFSLDVLLALQRGEPGRNALQLLVLPSVLLISVGLAALERSPQRRLRGIAGVTIVLLSLILCNNVLVTAVLHPPRGPKPPLLALERDRAAVRTYIAAEHPARRSLQAPQDTALLRELALRSGGIGIGPHWSLDQQSLSASWATRSLGLPIGTAEVCRQLTQAPHDLVVWMRADRSGPNSEASLRACLARDGAVWQPIGEQLGLRSGEVQVFRRLAPPRP